MKLLATAGLACLAWCPVLFAGEEGSSALTSEHWNAASTFLIRTPESWAVESHSGLPEVTEARGDGLLVRILRREGELGLDSLHVQCMLERLAGAMAARPQVDYEYDFVSGTLGGRRVLDSAFVVHYDEPIEGQKDWRQENLTVVGEGESVCVIGHAPLALWKKSKSARNLLKAVMESVRF
jgi:hypothetical protein